MDFSNLITVIIISLKGAIFLSLKLLLIIIPLMVFYEFVKQITFFKKGGKVLDYLMGKIGLSSRAAIPLFTGIFLGIAYGAGIIIHETREGSLAKREIFLIGLFLATCHAVVEDTLIFVIIGGNGWWILGPRIFLALTFTFILSRLFYYINHRI